ncbi:hypothetical protein EV714DRAFT_216940 [Schizophyllum commune]
MAPHESEVPQENNEDQSNSARDGNIHVQYDPDYPHSDHPWAMADGLRHPLLVLPNEDKTSSSATRRANLDQHIASIRNQLAALVIYRNSLADISSLPNEILGDIFLLYARETNTLSGLRWTKLLLVCRRWTIIGLSTPALWSYIEFDNYALAASVHTAALQQLCLPGAHPLTVAVQDDFREPFLTRILHLLASSMDRISSLKVGSAGPHLAELLEMLAQEKRINLRTLSLSLHGLPGEVFVVPGAHTEHIVCNLRILRLSNVSLDWSYLRNLSSITIINNYPTAPFLDVAALLEVLRYSPRLEDLFLNDCLTLSDTHERSAAMVELPYLEDLELWGRTSSYTALVSRLHFPRVRRVILEAYGVNDGPRIQPFVNHLHPLYRLSESRPLRLLQFYNSQQRVTFTWFSDTVVPDCHGPFLGGDVIPLKFTVYPRREPALRRIMGAIMRSLPAAAHVEVLDIRESFNKEMPQHTCAHLLDLLPALTTIILEMADYTLEMIDALHAAFLRWLERPDGRGPQPLRRIHYFASRYPRAEGITTVLLEDAVAARLSKLLRLYTSAGVSLEELRIEDVAERLPWGSLRVKPLHTNPLLWLTHRRRTLRNTWRKEQSS